MFVTFLFSQKKFSTAFLNTTWQSIGFASLIHSHLLLLLHCCAFISLTKSFHINLAQVYTVSMHLSFPLVVTHIHSYALCLPTSLVHTDTHTEEVSETGELICQTISVSTHLHWRHLTNHHLLTSGKLFYTQAVSDISCTSFSYFVLHLCTSGFNV